MDGKAPAIDPGLRIVAGEGSWQEQGMALGQIVPKPVTGIGNQQNNQGRKTVVAVGEQEPGPRLR